MFNQFVHLEKPHDQFVSCAMHMWCLYFRSVWKNLSLIGKMCMWSVCTLLYVCVCVCVCVYSKIIFSSNLMHTLEALMENSYFFGKFFEYLGKINSTIMLNWSYVNRDK